MIAHKMGSSRAGMYTTAKTSPVGNFKHGSENDMVINMATLFLNGAPLQSSFLGQSQTLDMKLGLRELQLEAFLICFCFFPIMFVIPTIASNNLVTE
jgi:hypothetical protein